MKYFFNKQVTDDNIIDYASFAGLFGSVLCNNIPAKLDLEVVNGEDFYEEDGYIESVDIYQYFIVDDFGASLIRKYTDEILYYCADLDIYVWAITHYGTSWSYVNLQLKNI